MLILTSEDRASIRRSLGLCGDNGQMIGSRSYHQTLCLALETIDALECRINGLQSKLSEIDRRKSDQNPPEVTTVLDAARIYRVPFSDLVEAILHDELACEDDPDPEGSFRVKSSDVAAWITRCKTTDR